MPATSKEEVIVHDQLDKDLLENVADSTQQLGHPVTAEGISSPQETAPINLNEDGKIEDPIIPDKEWFEAQAKSALDLGGTTTRVSEANLGKKGVLGRILRMKKPNQEVVEVSQKKAA